MPAANGLICSFKTCLILRVLCAKLFTVNIDISFLFYFNTFQKNRYRGGGDGTFRGQRYFNCAPDSGVFVALDKLTPIEDSDSKSPKSLTRDQRSPGIFASRIIPSVLIGKNDHEQRKRADYKVKIDERVVTFAGDVPVRGTVRYIGEDKDLSGQVHTVVGLELVSDIVNLVVTCRIHFKLLDKHFNFFISFYFFQFTFFLVLSKSLQSRFW